MVRKAGFSDNEGAKINEMKQLKRLDNLGSSKKNWAKKMTAKVSRRYNRLWLLPPGPDQFQQDLAALDRRCKGKLTF